MAKGTGFVGMQDYRSQNQNANYGSTITDYLNKRRETASGAISGMDTSPVIGADRTAVARDISEPTDYTRYERDRSSLASGQDPFEVMGVTGKNTAFDKALMSGDAKTSAQQTAKEYSSLADYLNQRRSEATSSASQWNDMIKREEEKKRMAEKASQSTTTPTVSTTPTDIGTSFRPMFRGF